MKKNIFVTGTILLAVLLFSCSSKSDPYSSAKQIIENRILKNSNGYFKLSTIQKNDAVTEKINGVDYYTLKCVTEVECIKDGGWIFVDNGGFILYKIAPFETNRDDGGGNVPIQLKIGDKYKLNDKITIVKHEQGWVEQ